MLLRKELLIPKQSHPRPEKISNASMGTKGDPFAFLDDPGEDVDLEDEAELVEESPSS